MTFGGSAMPGRYFTFSWRSLITSVSLRFAPSTSTSSSYTHMRTSVSKESYLAAFVPRMRATALPQLPLPSRHTRFGPVFAGMSFFGAAFFGLAFAAFFVTGFVTFFVGFFVTFFVTFLTAFFVAFFTAFFTTFDASFLAAMIAAGAVR